MGDAPSKKVTLTKLKEERDRLQSAVNELSILNELAHSIGVSRDAQQIMQKIVKLSIQTMKAEQGLIVLIDTQDKKSMDTLIRTTVGSQKHRAMHLDQTVLGWMQIHMKPLLLNDPQKDPRFRGTKWDTFVRSILCVPLMVKSELIGVLAIYNQKNHQGFTKENQRLLNIIASQSAQIVENARLYEEEKERLRIQQEAEITRIRNVELKDKNEQLKQLLTELKETQTHLIQSERMAALGSLVAGIVHELNSPIGASKSALDASDRCIDTIIKTLESAKNLDEFRNNPRMQTSLNVLQDNSWVMLSANERITKIVKSLKSFSRLDAPIFQKADLHEGLDSTLDLLEHEFKEDISIKTEYGKLPEITCFPSELNQVFMHLLTNAAQSISGKGKITIRTYLADNKIHIQITDSGRYCCR